MLLHHDLSKKVPLVEKFPGICCFSTFRKCSKDYQFKFKIKLAQSSLIDEDNNIDESDAVFQNCIIETLDDFEPFRDKSST